MNRQEYWHYFKAFMKDYFYYGLLYGSIYLAWCFLWKRHFPEIDKYDAYFYGLSIIFVAIIGPFGRKMAQEWALAIHHKKK